MDDTKKLKDVEKTTYTPDESLKNAIQTACKVTIHGTDISLSKLLTPYEMACYITGLIICSLENDKVHELDESDLTGYQLITESDGMRITAQVARYLYTFIDAPMTVYQFLGLLEMCYKDALEGVNEKGFSPNKTFLMHTREYVMPYITAKTTISDIVYSVPGSLTAEDMPWSFGVLQIFDACIKNANNLRDSENPGPWYYGTVKSDDMAENEKA